jgi:hypothetical protein
MNATITNGRKSRRGLAIILAAVLLLTTITGALATTLAAKPDLVVTIEAPTNGYTPLEVGAELRKSVGNLIEAYSSDTTIATVAFTPGSALRNLTTHGVKAGIMTTYYGNSVGNAMADVYQITDSRNITKYSITNGGEGVIPAVGGTLTIPLTVYTNSASPDQAAKSGITWSTFRPNDTVASVDANGTITGLSKGATIIIGEFTDKWGRQQDLHFLVGVGIKLDGNDKDKLQELIDQANNILAETPPVYTADSLADLADARDNGVGALGGDDKDAIANAIDDLEDALAGLEDLNNGGGNGGNGGLLGPDDNGNYYKPVGDPDNVFEVVDENGDSKQPPEYVYAPDGDPTDGDDNVPAYPDGHGDYYVEDPAGSNIFKEVDTDGDLIDNPAIWGGPDHQFGGGDDKPVIKTGGDYYVDCGQNVYQKVETPTTLGPKVGGGPDENPATDPVTPIYDNNGKYYVGPLGPDSDGNNYYYGDKATGGDGLVNSTDSTKHVSDDIYYLGADGNMTTTKPAPAAPSFPTPPSGNPAVANTGRLIDGTKIGDNSSDWLEIATSGDYSLIIRVNALSATTYAAQARTDVMNWYQKTFPSASALRPFISKNDAGWKNGDVNSLTAGRSKPTGVLATKADSDTCFPLSYGEYAQYCSNEAVDGSGTVISGAGAKANYKLITHEEQLTATYVSTGSGRLMSGTVKVVTNTDAATVHPAMWILTSAFNTLGK